MKKTLLFLLCLSAKILVAQTIFLRTNVEDLRLREQPNVESVIIKTVPIGTSLYWLNERSKQKKTIDWKGQKVTDYWYKVRIRPDSIGWVFGKGITLGYINFSHHLNDPWKPTNYDCEWLNIEVSSEESFLKLEKINPFTIKRLSRSYKKDTMLILPLQNKKSKEYVDKNYKDDYESKTYKLLGEIIEINQYLVYFEAFERWDYIFVNKKNGNESTLGTIGRFQKDNESAIHFSKNKKHL